MIGKNDDREGFILRLLVVFLYVGMLFVLTCSYSFNEVIASQKVSFVFNAEPNWVSFFEYKFSYSAPSYILQKAGHALSFFILAFLLMVVFSKLTAVLLLSTFFAVFTEVAQLFFHRTGCLVDVFIDLSGTAAFLLVCSLSKDKSGEVGKNVLG
ncbi:VanZ family protein [Bacillus sp. P14.5]|uniref:VanZ family protein n=1 Tax=Bacillus sp. P14.5 TaxID=1983400 RepID=UPI000DEA806E|nr:VanZ family protein [Bacillus sp. P14.5]